MLYPEFRGRAWMHQMQGYMVLVVPGGLFALCGGLLVWILLTSNKPFGPGVAVLSGITLFFWLITWGLYHLAAKHHFSLARAMREPRILVCREGLRVRTFSSSYREELRSSLGSQPSPNLDLFDRDGEAEVIWVPWDLIREIKVDKNLLQSTLVIKMHVLRGVPEDTAGYEIIGGIHITLPDVEIAQSPKHIAEKLNEWLSSPATREQLEPHPAFPVDVTVNTL